MAKRHIPERVKRQVRQECGFGCVLCGVQIYQYDHIVPFSKVKEHKPENISLLCPTHHQQKTSGQIDAKTIAKARSRPYAIQRGRLAPWRILHLEGNWFQIRAADGLYHAQFRFGNRNVYDVIVLDNQRMLSLEWDGEAILLDMLCYDKAGKVACSVKRSEFSLFPSSWDIGVVGSSLKIFENQTSTVLDMNFHAPQTIFVNKANFTTGKSSCVICDPWVIMDSRFGSRNIRLTRAISIGCHTLAMVASDYRLFGSALFAVDCYPFET